MPASLESKDRDCFLLECICRSGRIQNTHGYTDEMFVRKRGVRNFLDEAVASVTELECVEYVTNNADVLRHADSDTRGLLWPACRDVLRNKSLISFSVARPFTGGPAKRYVTKNKEERWTSIAALVDKRDFVCSSHCFYFTCGQ